MVCPGGLARVTDKFGEGEWLLQQARKGDYFGVEGRGGNPKQNCGRKHKHITKFL